MKKQYPSLIEITNGICKLFGSVKLLLNNRKPKGLPDKTDLGSKETVRVLREDIKEHSPYEVKSEVTSFADGNGTIIDEYVHIKKSTGGNKE